MNTEDLKKYDYVVMIDKSGSMAACDCKSGKSRWKEAEFQTKAIAQVAESFDDDGIDVVVFNNTAVLYSGVTSSKTADIFSRTQPSGSTDTAAALKMILDGYFKRKGSTSKGLFSGLFGKKETEKIDPLKPKVKPMIVLCITDGEPNDQNAVANVIVDATKKLDSEDEIGISFIQIGRDKGARRFLKFLDDELESKGAKFDIVDCKNDEEIDNMSIVDVLMQAVTD